MDVELNEIQVDRPEREKKVWAEHELIKQAEDTELNTLQTELDEAKKAYDAAKQAAADRSWSSWLKYALYTPSSKASSAEVLTFLSSRVALLNGVTNLGFMIAYLLPGMTATDVYRLDQASNSTSPVQLEMDRANYEYYWSNVASYGTQTLVSFGAALMSLSYSYKSMRERIEADKKSEFELARERLAEHKRSLEKAAERKEKRRKLERLLRVAETTAEEQAKELHANALKTEELNAQLDAARSRIGKLGGALTKAEEEIGTRERQEAELQSKVKELVSALEKAQRDTETKARQSEEQAREAARLTEELKIAHQAVKNSELNSQALELRLQESELKQQILESVVDKLATISDKVDSAVAQIDGVKSTVEQTNSLLANQK